MQSEVTGYLHVLLTQQLSRHLMWWQCNMRLVSAFSWLALKTETSVSLSDERSSITSSNRRLLFVFCLYLSLLYILKETLLSLLI